MNHDIINERSRIEQPLLKLATLHDSATDAHTVDGHRNKIISLDTLYNTDYQVDYIIDNYIVERGVNQIFGESGHMKSFVALDMMCHVAAGTQWHGHEVKQGWTLYIIGEDFGGYRQRGRVWLDHNLKQPHEVPIYFHVDPVLFPDETEVNNFRSDISKVIKSIGSSPTMICIDTKARCMLGNENSTQDANKWISCIDKIAKDFNTTILIVHHTGHMDKSRSRGAYSFLAALDSEFKVNKDTAGNLCLSSVKPPKNDTPPPDRWFKPIVLKTPYQKKTGEYLTSIALTAIETPKRDPLGGLNPKKKAAFNILIDLNTGVRDRLEASGDNPDNAKVEIKVWFESLISEGIIDSNANPSSIRQAKSRLRRGLEDSKLVVIDGNFIAPVINSDD